MQINTNYHFNPVTRAGTDKPVAPPAPEAQDVASFSGSKGLDDALAKSPEVRAGEVARAKELVKQSDYPPAEMIRKIGFLMAGALGDKS
jgi:hypothetical protein